MQNEPASNARIILCPLSVGEIDLLRRALRYYAHAEQSAVAEAAKRKRQDPLHYEDVKRQVAPRVLCAEALCERLLHDPEGRGYSRYRHTTEKRKDQP